MNHQARATGNLMLAQGGILVDYRSWAALERGRGPAAVEDRNAGDSGGACL
jgi:hypothetical protein